MEIDNPQVDSQISKTDNTLPTSPRKRFLLPLALSSILVVGLAVLGWLIYARQKQVSQIETTIQPYFNYSQKEITHLGTLKTKQMLTVQQAREWELKAYTLVEENPSVDASKVYAYLTVAQMDAVALSYMSHKQFLGDLSAVSKGVLCEFFVDSCYTLSASSDEYSNALSDLIVAKVKHRIAEDDKRAVPYSLKSGNDVWTGPAPQIGLSDGNFLPWLVVSSSQFRAAPPPASDSAELQEQLATVKKTLASVTNQQKAIVVTWAGGPGTKTPPGQWLDIASQYLLDKGYPLDIYVEARAVTAMSMADALICVFDSKYTYQYKRPNMFDTSIVTVMPTPNHPSYPAGHATVSWAAATILAHYAPEHKTEWERLAVEASDSRTLGGIHFPMDNAAGTTLGKSVGNEALKVR